MSSPTTQHAISEANLSATSADLFRACAAGGSDRAWREFVQRFHGRLVMAVRRTLLRLGGVDPHDERVEDLVQDVYCRLLGDGRRRRRFHGSSEGQLMSYLQRVVVSVIVDARREALAEKRWGGHRITLADWQRLPVGTIVEETSPEDRLLAEERRRSFLRVCRQALGRRADATTVRIAHLALLEGWSSREIAEVVAGRMGIAGVDSIIHRLRRSLADRGIALPRRDRRRDLQSPPGLRLLPTTPRREANQAAPRIGRQNPVR